MELTTITLGANPEYASEGFYKEHMEEDGSRVERLFRVSFAIVQFHQKYNAVNSFFCRGTRSKARIAKWDARAQSED